MKIGWCLTHEVIIIMQTQYEGLMNLFIANDVHRKMCFFMNGCHMVRDTECLEKVVKGSITFVSGKNP